MLSDFVKGRLTNWKFTSAHNALENSSQYLALTEPSSPTEFERRAVASLSALLGNSGWFDGALGEVVECTVAMLVSGNTED